MAFKIPVEDRIPTYPGRVKLTPVAGETNTYDMTRADLPIAEGTPLNKALLDNKAYALTEDVTVYVANSGSDINGDGSADNPFATIQKAVDALPRYLDGHTATISIAFGVYPERVIVKDFCGGRLVVGKYGEVFTIDGIDIINSSFVETNIYQIERASGSSRPLFLVQNGSNVFVGSDMILDGIDSGVTGMIVENNSHVVGANNVKLIANNCAGAVVAQWCSFVSFTEITGSGNVFGVGASYGAIISYKNETIDMMWSNTADTGGLVLTGSNSTTLSDATIEL